MFTKGSIVLFGSSESKYGIWCCQEIHSSHVPGLENGDIDLRFPCFPDLVRYKRRAGDFIWNSSEKDDLKFRHLFMSVETSWNILEDLCLPRCFSTFVLPSKPSSQEATGHSPGTPASMWGKPCCRPVLVGSGRGTLESLECCHMLPWGDQINEIDGKFSCWSLV